jgi:4a-hydroxytetrahydrobiopterin dehydratase
MSDPLAAEDLAKLLKDLPGWSGDQNGLTRTWRFNDFLMAIGFMHDAAPAINAANHHPEWTNVYNRVSVQLRTHDAGDQVTDKDIKLARLLDVQARHHGGH